MSDMPETIAVWRFAPEKADEWLHGGWSLDHDRKTTSYVRADVADALTAEVAALKAENDRLRDALAIDTRKALKGGE